MVCNWRCWMASIETIILRNLYHTTSSCKHPIINFQALSTWMHWKLIVIPRLVSVFFFVTFYLEQDFSSFGSFQVLCHNSGAVLAPGYMVSILQSDTKWYLGTWSTQWLNATLFSAGAQVPVLNQQVWTQPRKKKGRFPFVWKNRSFRWEKRNTSEGSVFCLAKFAVLIVLSRVFYNVT